jgi:DNA-binding LytR/AlgR family response regulator
MLEGSDSQWHYTVSKTANYSNLAPGKYQFIVQVKGENPRWETQSVSIPIYISPPFWNTWWFITLVIAALVFLIYLFFKYRILLYNKALVRELLRLALKRLRKKSKYILVKEGSTEVKILCHEIRYIKSDGNYIEIYHDKGKTVVRYKIGEFLDLVPDPLEYIRIRRSYIIRLDRVEEKGKNMVVVAGEKLQVGVTYQKELSKIQL